MPSENEHLFLEKNYHKVDFDGYALLIDREHRRVYQLPADAEEAPLIQDAWTSFESRSWLAMLAYRDGSKSEAWLTDLPASDLDHPERFIGSLCPQVQPGKSAFGDAVVEEVLIPQRPFVETSFEAVPFCSNAYDKSQADLVSSIEPHDGIMFFADPLSLRTDQMFQLRWAYDSYLPEDVQAFMYGSKMDARTMSLIRHHAGIFGEDRLSYMHGARLLLGLAEERGEEVRSLKDLARFSREHAGAASESAASPLLMGQMLASSYSAITDYANEIGEDLETLVMSFYGVEDAGATIDDVKKALFQESGIEDELVISIRAVIFDKVMELSAHEFCLIHEIEDGQDLGQSGALPHPGGDFL